MYILTPTIIIEPRFYYNINKRSSKGEKTLNNSADYFSVAAFYVPGLFHVSNRDNATVTPQFGLVPMWGLRRALGNKFSFELAVGYGVAIAEKEVTTGLDLALRLGYVFYKKK